MTASLSIQGADEELDPLVGGGWGLSAAARGQEPPLRQLLVRAAISLCVSLLIFALAVAGQHPAGEAGMDTRAAATAAAPVGISLDQSPSGTNQSR